MPRAIKRHHALARQACVARRGSQPKLCVLVRAHVKSARGAWLSRVLLPAGRPSSDRMDADLSQTDWFGPAPPAPPAAEPDAHARHLQGVVRDFFNARSSITAACSNPDLVRAILNYIPSSPRRKKYLAGLDPYLGAASQVSALWKRVTADVVRQRFLARWPGNQGYGEACSTQTLRKFGQIFDKSRLSAPFPVDDVLMFIELETARAVKFCQCLDLSLLEKHDGQIDEGLGQSYAPHSRRFQHVSEEIPDLYNPGARGRVLAALKHGYGRLAFVRKSTGAMARFYLTAPKYGGRDVDSTLECVLSPIFPYRTRGALAGHDNLVVEDRLEIGLVAQSPRLGFYFDRKCLRYTADLDPWELEDPDDEEHWELEGHWGTGNQGPLTIQTALSMIFHCRCLYPPHKQ